MWHPCNNLLTTFNNPPHLFPHYRLTLLFRPSARTNFSVSQSRGCKSFQPLNSRQLLCTRSPSTGTWHRTRLRETRILRRFSAVVSRCIRVTVVEEISPLNNFFRQILKLTRIELLEDPKTLAKVDEFSIICEGAVGDGQGGFLKKGPQEDDNDAHRPPPKHWKHYGTFNTTASKNA